jgi:hypothetical protein
VRPQDPSAAADVKLTDLVCPLYTLRWAAMQNVLSDLVGVQGSFLRNKKRCTTLSGVRSRLRFQKRCLQQALAPPPEHSCLSSAVVQRTGQSQQCACCLECGIVLCQ